VTTSAGPSPTGTPPVSAETPSAWVTPAPAEASQSQFRPSVP
jgi:hypothetical protein